QDLTPQQQQQEVDRQAIAIAKAPFGLAQGPLLRTRLLRLDACTHVLCVCLHHIIADGWALGIFIRELTALYDALQAGRPSPLAPLTVQYVDYGLWQRQRLQGDKGDRHLQYWQQQLQDAPTLLALPTDYPRPPVQSLNGARHPIKLGQPLTQAVKHLGQAAGATVFMTILAAFKVLLYRYTHQQDLLVGTPVANRNQVATEGLIGVLVNTLAIRTQLQAEESFQTLLQQVRDRVIEANTHQDLPFEKLVEVLQPDRSRSYAPLLQVMLTVQNLPLDPHTCGNLTLQVEPLATDTIQFDLMLNLVESADGLQGWLEYNTDIFAAATIERMAQHLHGLLEQVVAAPDCAIAQFSLLTPPEHQLLASWNNTQVDTPAEPSIQQLFEAQVARTPDAIAVVFESQALSYRALNTRANQLAHHLQTLGVTAENLVGVYMERSLEMIVGLLAILKAGGVYVPLDPSYPQARLQFMVEDTQVPVLLTQTQCLAKLPALPARIVVVDRDWATIAQAPDQNPAQPTITRDHLAYVIYTSGSTGQPKGVCVTHGGVIRLVIDPGYVTLCDRDVFLQLAPISFDAATFEIWGALLNGAKLVLYPKPKPDLDILAAILQQEAVSILWLTAGLFHLVVEQRLDSLIGVKQILAGGDVLSPQQVQKALAALPNATLINGYGPTENTTFTCCYTIPALIEANRSILIGTPIANTQVYLLDAHLQLVPIGVAGELYIGGDGLARGYLNQPALTAERFIDNPFGPGRLYKSGDLARYLPDGNLEYLGRIDHQVKLRGFRIELGEIEAVLNRHNQVQQSVVVLREDSPGDKRLIAYFVGDDTLEKEYLYIHLKAQLPDYMVPSAIMPLASLPLTPNGKIDRQALPAPT
ncbi:MAG: amino acid adenylation domain-containing protein, partial [Cyanobacteria bacterium J06659_2]